MNPEIHDWYGLRVWLIGASCAMGVVLARELVHRGASLALSARTRGELKALDINHALLLACDVTDEASLAAAWTTVRQEMGEVDLILYLTANSPPQGSADPDPAQAEQMLELNFKGALRLCHCVLPRLREKGGGIVFATGLVQPGDLPQPSADGPANTALIQLAQRLHRELMPQGVGVWIMPAGLVREGQLTPQVLKKAEPAARFILNGFQSGDFEIAFPTRFAWLAALLPRWPWRRFKLMRRSSNGRLGRAAR